MLYPKLGKMLAAKAMTRRPCRPCFCPGDAGHVAALPPPRRSPGPPAESQNRCNRGQAHQDRIADLAGSASVHRKLLVLGRRGHFRGFCCIGRVTARRVLDGGGRLRNGRCKAFFAGRQHIPQSVPFTLGGGKPPLYLDVGPVNGVGAPVAFVKRAPVFRSFAALGPVGSGSGGDQMTGIGQVVGVGGLAVPVPSPPAGPVRID